MEHKRWIGSHDWKTSDECIGGNLSFNDRCHTETQDLDDLIHWLEYANTGYPAARQSIDQEEYWAKLIRNLLCKKLIKNLRFYSDCVVNFRCSMCNALHSGFISSEKIEIDEPVCIHLTSRTPDILPYIKDKFIEYGELYNE